MKRLVMQWACLGLAMFGLAACESGGKKADATTGTTGTDGDPPLSSCTYKFTSVNASGSSIGTRCTADTDCEFGVCLLPGEPGNIAGEFGHEANEPTNTQFGFCTRGCDCDNDETSRLTDEEKVDFVCYNGPIDSQGKLKYVLPRCVTVGDCASFDSGYTECALPRGSGVFKACLAP